MDLLIAFKTLPLTFHILTAWGFRAARYSKLIKLSNQAPYSSKVNKHRRAHMCSVIVMGLGQPQIPLPRLITVTSVLSDLVKHLDPRCATGQTALKDWCLASLYITTQQGLLPRAYERKHILTLPEKEL